MGGLVVVGPGREPLYRLTTYRLPQEPGQLQDPLSTRCLGVEDVQQPAVLQVSERGADINRLCDIAPQGIEQPDSRATLPRCALGGFKHDAKARVFFAQANAHPHRQGGIIQPRRLT